MSTTIEVNPLEIKKTVEPGKEYKETLTVRNIGEERFSYQIRAEEAYRAWVDPDPNLFAIEVDSSREVTLELRPPRSAKKGLHEFKLFVINDDKENDRAEVDMALRVPVPVLWWVIIAVVIVVILIILWQLVFRQIGYDSTSLLRIWDQALLLA